MEFREFLHLKRCIHIGEEVALSYKGEEYWISHLRDGRTVLTRSKDSSSQIFGNVEQLFEQGKIEGRYLRNMYTEIE